MATNEVVLKLKVTQEEREQIEALAHQRGYDVLEDYVRALIEADLEADPDQAYFWSKEWQTGEREADEDIAAGRVETFDTMDDLISDLLDDDE